MSDTELRKAAEMLAAGYKNCEGKPERGCSECDEEWDGMVTLLARAWLAENKPDDGELLDGAWLLSVGFIDGGGMLEVEHVHEPYVASTISWEMRFDRWLIGGGSENHQTKAPLSKPLKTRGDVRRLCAALGIVLKTSPVTEPVDNTGS